MRIGTDILDNVITDSATNIAMILEIAEKGRQILSKHKLLSVPVQIEKLVEIYDITIKEEDIGYKGQPAAQAKRAQLDFENKTIILDNHISPFLKRYALAYELGHFFLRTTKISGRKIPDIPEGFELPIQSCYKFPLIPKVQANFYADIFAACLLMPYNIVFRYIPSITYNKSRCFSIQEFYEKLADMFKLDLIDATACYHIVRLLWFLKANEPEINEDLQPAEE